jgi:hypothetical protein
MKCIWLVVKNGQLRKKEKKGKKKEGRDVMSIKIRLNRHRNPNHHSRFNNE